MKIQGDIETGRLCQCGDCEDCHAYKLHMAQREAKARERRFCVVPMHKSNYIPVTNREDLKGINNKGGFYR